MELAPIFFGLFIGLFIHTLTKVVQQTRAIWRRTHSLSNVYLYMIWVEALVNLVFALTTFLFINGFIQSSLAYYIGAVTLWAIQTQLLSQIIANRVSLIMVDRRKARWLKWGLFISTGIINIAVYAIWIPAYLPAATNTQIVLNSVFERVEKTFFLVVDFGLNLFFLYLVRYRLIADGLSKYWPLFNFNAVIVVVSVSMDVLLLGMLSLPSPYDYVQFAPVAYIVKLHIELTMAVLISKVVRNVSGERVDDWYAKHNNTANNAGRAAAGASNPRHEKPFGGSMRMSINVSGGQPDATAERGYDIEREADGIVKTVTMVVSRESGEESGEEFKMKAKRHVGEFTSSEACLCEPRVAQ